MQVSTPTNARSIDLLEWLMNWLGPRKIWLPSLLLNATLQPSREKKKKSISLLKVEIEPSKNASRHASRGLVDAKLKEL